MRLALSEDQQDLLAFSDRVAEETITYEQLLDDLKAHGKIWPGFQKISHQRFTIHPQP